MSQTVPSLNILQWNCRSALRRLPEISYILEKHKINVAAFCETRLETYVHPIFTNHVVITKDRNRHGGGVAILVEKRFRVSVIQEANIDQLCSRNDIEFLLCKIWLELDKHIYVCSLYSPPRGSNHHPTDPHAWRDLLRYCLSFNLILVCGDVNGKTRFGFRKFGGPMEREVK